MMRTLQNIFLAAFCVALLGVSTAEAQDQTQDQQQPPPPQQSSQPIPAYRSPLASAADNSDVDSQQGTVDNRSLSGAQNLSPLFLPTRSYWEPQINVYGTADSNPNQNGNTTSWSAGAAVSGRIDVHRISGSSVLDLSYTGGGVFSGDNNAGNGIVQALSVEAKRSFHRSSISFLDQVSYLPGSSFGFGGLGGTTFPAGGSNGLGPVFGPGQSILTGQGQTLENSFVTEFDANLTPRASITLVGGYYLLHSFNGSLFNSGNPNFRGGYNYALTRKDQVALLYTFSDYIYGNSIQSIQTHTGQLSYGRVISQRLSFQIAAGPQYIISQLPLTAGATTVAASSSQLSWAMNTSLTWTGKRNAFNGSYYRGANNGSGVLAGSISDTVSGTFTRQASRTFSSSITGGYSHNEGATTAAAALTNQTFDYWYGNASLSHPIGRSLGLTLSYLLQYQNNTSALCASTTCGPSTIRHLIAFGVGWHERPLLF